MSEGSGRNADRGCSGGKTATSQTLPRSANRYISSFLGFMPAEDPQILGLCIIHDPAGRVLRRTIAAPVIKNIFEAVLSVFEKSFPTICTPYFAGRFHPGIRMLVAPP